MSSYPPTDPALQTAGIAFIGAGNMGGAIAGGLAQSGHAPERISLYDTDAARANSVANAFGMRPARDAGDAIADADIVILAVKPQQVTTALASLRAGLNAHKPLLISIAAGVSTANLAKHSGLASACVRAMPNLPALVGAGVTGLFGTGLTGSMRAQASYVMGAVGEVVWLEDEQAFDALTALSGSGPAYFFALTEAMAAAGRELGLSSALAEALARQTLIGAGALVAGSSDSVTLLRERVTSKGGTTAAALDVWQAHPGLFELAETAMRAAATRSAELGAALEEGSA